ncbi:serine hydrolase [candidate division KSB1 bacterium]|nr:serine hydrolase [candidate division KSB1 bacterium]
MAACRSFSTPQTDGRFLDLQAKLEDRLRSKKGDYSLALGDLETGENLLINAFQTHHAASTMKTAVMVEVFRRAERGLGGLDDSIRVHNRFRSLVDSSFFSLQIDPQSKDPTVRALGGRMTRRELVEQMITISSNLATNLLMEELTPESIAAMLKSLGAGGLHVRRGVMDLKAYEAGLNNTTDAFSLLQLYKAIAQDRAASAKSCAEMRAILARQKYRDRIAAGLPPNARWAGKTGSITAINHDSGILTLADGRRFALVILSQGETDAKQSTRTLVDLTGLIIAEITQSR